MQMKRSKFFETEEAMPTKIGFHAFHVNLYLHEFFEPILKKSPKLKRSHPPVLLIDLVWSEREWRKE